MTAPECIEDPTIVACTDESIGRQLDPLPEVLVDQAPATVAEVGTVDPTPHLVLAETGVDPAAALLLAFGAVAFGAFLGGLSGRRRGGGYRPTSSPSHGIPSDTPATQRPAR